MGKPSWEHSSPEGLGQTLGTLVIDISLSPKYVNVRARHITCRHQPLKSIKGAIMCIKTVSDQLYSSSCVSLKLKNISLTRISYRAIVLDIRQKEKHFINL